MGERKLYMNAQEAYRGKMRLDHRLGRRDGSGRPRIRGERPKEAEFHVRFEDGDGAIPDDMPVVQKASIFALLSRWISPSSTKVLRRL